MVLGQTHHRTKPSRCIGDQTPVDSADKRIHTCKRELKKVFSIEQNTALPYKPVGLWYAFGTDWIDWCHHESFLVDSIKFGYEITLEPESDVLSIKTVEELDSFSKEYTLKHSQTFFQTIDWYRVSQDYAGIEINPYQWSRRMNLSWYYAWDIASGCIWDNRAIKELVPIDVEPLKLICKTA